MLLSKEEFITLILIVSLTIAILLVFFLIVLALNIRIRKQKEIELLNANITTQENERQRIAEDLHDELGPILSNVKLQVNHLPNSDNILADSKYISSQLDSAIANVRYLSKYLSSSSVVTKGLTQSIIDLKYIIEKSGSIEFIINTSELPKTISEFSLSTIYRIIQEMITNSVRHSMCSKINLDLTVIGRFLILTYCDNGKLENVNNESKSGFGLSNISNRVSLLKGRFLERPDFVSSKTYSIQFKLDLLS